MAPDQRWLEAHIGEGKRWGSTTALLEDAIVLLRELEVLEGNVRQEFLRKQLEALRLAQQRSQGQAPLGAMPAVAKPQTRRVPDSTGFVDWFPIPPRAPRARGLEQGGPGLLGMLFSGKQELAKIKPAYEEAYGAALAARDWTRQSALPGLWGI